jgi:hypothetical protein
MKPYLYLLLLLTAASCAPRTLHLTPIAQEFGTDGDRRVVKDTRDGLKIVTSFDGRWGDLLVFDTEISNESDSAMDIRPVQFTVQGLDATWAVVGDRFSKQTVFSAADPDESIRLASDRMRRAERRAKFNRVFNTVLFIAAIANDAAAAASSDRTRNPNRYVQNRVTAQNLVQLATFKDITDRQRYATDLDRWSHYRRVFEAEPLRRMRLAPGDGVRGRVYVPRVPGAAFVRLNYPASDGTFSFVFEQKWVKPAR